MRFSWDFLLAYINMLENDDSNYINMLENDDSNLQTKFRVHITSNIFKITKF